MHREDRRAGHHDDGSYNILKKRPAFVQRSEETQLPVEVARGKSGGRE